ncbi:two-pore potassium channel 5 [Ricinus communis]|uniref:Calcium-activated outward-rectifying potassium channel, putative n=1 Tax=Ricinus communis TaxID=3988 RepID=B9RN50_RICCO|nr:two-pore potassium channel 5 [Ricinus communis]EEF47173.1 Calcium-activated outward-rectifying potassium channel, putative [Ricinus communis]|eukprot:XP_002515189.1 two-pore potassium channel 5 [Ricinus communis]
MENEPFLASQTRPQSQPQLQSILERHDLSFTLSPSLSSPILFSEIQEQPVSTAILGAPSTQRKKPGSLHRSKTAPAMVVMRDLKPLPPQDPKPQSESSSIIRQAIFLLFLYLLLGVVIYSFNRDNFSGIETHPVVDALYFCIVTMCTIGYGDIAPLTPATKVFACVFVLVGFGFIDILLSGVVNYVLDLQESMILAGIQMGNNRTAHEGFSARNYIVDVEKGRMRIRLKVGLALGVVVLCIGIGTLVLYYLEDLDCIDSIYLAVMSVTTVGYGDRVFKTLPGRLFAAIWLLVSSLAVARAFLYLAEARIDKRHRRITKWVLHRDITVEDLIAADINNNGFISKSEYVIYKLKEMGKIGEKDILQICNQFSKLDPNNLGKITLPDLLENRL